METTFEDCCKPQPFQAQGYCSNNALSTSLYSYYSSSWRHDDYYSQTDNLVEYHEQSRNSYSTVDRLGCTPGFHDRTQFIENLSSTFQIDHSDNLELYRPVDSSSKTLDRFVESEKVASSSSSKWEGYNCSNKSPLNKPDVTSTSVSVFYPWMSEKRSGEKQRSFQLQNRLKDSGN